jgi:8-oxo-dGTP diphosphatase
VADKFSPPARVLSSPYLRCLQTVAPLAAYHQVVVERADKVAEGQSAKAVHLVRDLAGDGTVVLCTHGDVIVEVLVALADEDRLDLGPNPRQAKGSVWALEARKGRFTTAHYFPPVVAELA